MYPKERAQQQVPLKSIIEGTEGKRSAPGRSSASPSEWIQTDDVPSRHPLISSAEHLYLDSLGWVLPRLGNRKPNCSWKYGIKSTQRDGRAFAEVNCSQRSGIRGLYSGTHTHVKFGNTNLGLDKRLWMRHSSDVEFKSFVKQYQAVFHCKPTFEPIVSSYAKKVMEKDRRKIWGLRPYRTWWWMCDKIASSFRWHLQIQQHIQKEAVIWRSPLLS